MYVYENALLQTYGPSREGCAYCTSSMPRVNSLRRGWIAPSPLPCAAPAKRAWRAAVSAVAPRAGALPAARRGRFFFLFSLRVGHPTPHGPAGSRHRRRRHTHPPHPPPRQPHSHGRLRHTPPRRPPAVSPLACRSRKGSPLPPPSATTTTPPPPPLPRGRDSRRAPHAPPPPRPGAGRPRAQRAGWGGRLHRGGGAAAGRRAGRGGGRGGGGVPHPPSQPPPSSWAGA